MSKGLLPPRKSKRVKWVPDANLCQVKLFLSEDCPSKIGNKVKDDLQAKTSWMLQSDGMGFDDPPPGFGGRGFLETLKQTCVPQIKWKCPPLFILNDEWHVVAGELSEETGTQNYREMRVLEAVYPRPSAIPSSPSVSPSLEERDYDDHDTPLISVIPFEEEDAVDYESSPCRINQDEVAVALTRCSAHEESKVIESVGIATCFEADTVAVASAIQPTFCSSPLDKVNLKRPLDERELLQMVPATFSHVLGSNDSTSDTFTRPLKHMMRKPMNFDLESSFPSSQTTMTTMLNQEPAMAMSPRSGNLLNNYSHQMFSPTLKEQQSLPFEIHSVMSSMLYSSSSSDRPNVTSIATAAVKDVSYYKSLIKLHGTERYGSQEGPMKQYISGASELTTMSEKDARAKIPKSCKFFNSSQGCRKGLSCPFQHD